MHKKLHLYYIFHRSNANCNQMEQWRRLLIQKSIQGDKTYKLDQTAGVRIYPLFPYACLHVKPAALEKCFATTPINMHMMVLPLAKFLCSSKLLSQTQSPEHRELNIHFSFLLSLFFSFFKLTQAVAVSLHIFKCF